jgi:hypothetical protein
MGMDYQTYMLCYSFALPQRLYYVLGKRCWTKNRSMSEPKYVPAIATALSVVASPNEISNAITLQ